VWVCGWVGGWVGRPGGSGDRGALHSRDGGMRSPGDRGRQEVARRGGQLCASQAALHRKERERPITHVSARSPAALTSRAHQPPHHACRVCERLSRRASRCASRADRDDITAIVTFLPFLENWNDADKIGVGDGGAGGGGEGEAHDEHQIFLNRGAAVPRDDRTSPSLVPPHPRHANRVHVVGDSRR
jgi:hypothetical protein